MYVKQNIWLLTGGWLCFDDALPDREGDHVAHTPFLSSLFLECSGLIYSVVG
jgi:hypothetical protein